MFAAAKGKPEKPDALARLERASVALRPCSTIGRYPCREEEQKRVFEHLKTAVKQGGSNQVLYMSGMPGTGKTAVFLDTVEKLRTVRGMPKFVFAHVNAMRLGTPQAVFGAIVKQMPRKVSSGRATAAGAAPGELENFFTGRSELDPVVLLLIDEIDQLVTRNQAVLYQIFNWLLTPSSRLVVSAISNTMDLAERLLPRVCSRFTILRVDYKAYSRDQISQILAERLQKHDAEGAMTKDALRLCAARVASAGGDLRKALQLCHRAVEVKLAQRQGDEDVGPVDTSHLARATKDLLHSSPAADAVRRLAVKPRRLLVALVVEIRHKETPPLRKVIQRYGKLASATGLHDSHRTAVGDAGADPWTEFGGEPWSDEGMELVKRLEAMSLLEVRRTQDGSSVVDLLAIKADELAPVLLEVESDQGVRSLIEG